MVEQSKDAADVKIAGVSASDIKESAITYYEDVQDRLIDIDKQVRRTVSARPLACVAGAFAVGFIAARTLRMWRHR